MLITRKRIVLTIGIGCILWGYYQLFGVEPEKSYINKQVMIIAQNGLVSGKVLNIKDGEFLISSNSKIFKVSRHNIFKVGDLFVDEYETKRVINAVFITMLGGILIWTDLFFL
jgi:hypothetical protein